MPHVIKYHVFLSGERDHEELLLHIFDSQEEALSLVGDAINRGYDAYIEEELITCDESQIVNELIADGWGDYSFGELRKTAKTDASVIYDSKMCIFGVYGSGEEQQLVPVAWLDRVNKEGPPIWRLLPGGIEQYMNKYDISESMAFHLSRIHEQRSSWMDDYTKHLKMVGG